MDEVPGRECYLHHGDRCLPLKAVLSRSQLLGALQTQCKHFQVGATSTATPLNQTEPILVLGAHLPPDLLFWLVALLEGSDHSAPGSAWSDLDALSTVAAYLALDEQALQALLGWCRSRWLTENRISRWSTLYHTVDKLLQQLPPGKHATTNFFPLMWTKLRRVARVPYLLFPHGRLEQNQATAGALARVTGPWADVFYLQLEAEVVQASLAELAGQAFFNEVAPLGVFIVGEAVYAAVYSHARSTRLERVAVDVVARSSEGLEALLRTALQLGYTVAWDEQQAHFSAARTGHALRLNWTSARTPEGLLLFRPQPRPYQMFYCTESRSAAASVIAASEVFNSAAAEYHTSFQNKQVPEAYLLHVVLRMQNFLVPNFLALNLPFPTNFAQHNQGVPAFLTPFCRIVVYHKYHNELELGFELGDCVAHVRTELAALCGSAELLYVRVPLCVYQDLSDFGVGSYARVRILPVGTSSVAHRIVPLLCRAVNYLELLDRSEVPRSKA